MHVLHPVIHVHINEPNINDTLKLHNHKNQVMQNFDLQLLSLKPDFALHSCFKVNANIYHIMRNFDCDCCY